MVRAQVPASVRFKTTVTTDIVMTTAGFLRILSSAVPLLLAITTTTTTTLVQLAGAFSSDLTNAPVTGYTTDGTDAMCFTEQTACAADATCTTCHSGGSNSAAVDECLMFNTVTTSSRGCDFRLDSACCMDDVSDFECLDNEAFVALEICFLEEHGCAVDEITCDGDKSTNATDGTTSDLGATSTALALSCAFMGLLTLLWV